MSAAWGADLVHGAARFADWRRGREVGTRIPTPLWELAVSLALRHGVSRTSQALRIGYYSLQERVEARRAAPAASTVESTMSRTFVELPAASFGAACECSIEFEKPSGAKVRIQIRGPQLPDLAALGREFWESR
jgi:hypothetical protein